MASNQQSQSEIFDAGIEMMTRKLPLTWSVCKQTPTSEVEDADLLLRSPNNGSQTLIYVEVRSSASLRDIEALIGGAWRRWRKRMSHQPVLLIAPYIGPRVRELLIEENVSFVDLTGNVRISIDTPGVFIETDGAQQDPQSQKPRTKLRGPKAGAVVRAIIDIAPPYSAADIASTARVNPGYLSRLLDALESEGLIDRERSGPITRVDWPRVIQKRAASYDPFRSASARNYVARQGPLELINKLRRRQRVGARPPTITGSFAAARIAPIAAPALLVIYTDTPDALAQELELLPADAGADTVLIRPDNDVVFDRVSLDGGIAWASPSQMAIDCLAGSGRMPAEGDALIEWMRRNEPIWRYTSIRDLLDEPLTVGSGE